MLEHLLSADTAARIAGAVQQVGALLDPIDAAVDVVQGPDAGDPTRSGTLARGPRPDASELRSADLDVPGTPDLQRARRDADRTLASIDFSRPEISLWVPATGSHAIPADWRDAVEQGPAGARTSLALVDYPASGNFNDSVATGQETLRLVLAGIAERGGSHRVTVAGHSQGAWVIGDTIADPVVGRAVDAAVLYGHPAPAHVDWSANRDPRVRQVDDREDPFTFPLDGGRAALAAVDDLHDSVADGTATVSGALHDIATVGRAALENPRLATYLIGKHLLPDASAYDPGSDPHHYESAYGDGARFLAA